MKFVSLPLLRLLTCAAFVFSVLSARAEDKKADPTGTWTWTQQGRQGGQSRDITLKINKQGDKYAGTISGRNGDTKLDNVKVEGDTLSFSVTREFNGNSFTTKHSGKISGDTITGKIEMERDGQTNSRDWTAKRKKE